MPTLKVAAVAGNAGNARNVALVADFWKGAA